MLKKLLPPKHPAPAAASDRGFELPSAPGDAPWQETQVVKTLWPPQAGTRALKLHYGAPLVCVRYRQDPTGQYRYTTVELMVDHAPIRRQNNGPARYLLPVSFWDQALRNQLLAHGAKWHHEEQAWILSKSTAAKLGVLRLIRRFTKKSTPANSHINVA